MNLAILPVARAKRIRAAVVVLGAIALALASLTQALQLGDGWRAWPGTPAFESPVETSPDPSR